MLLKSPVSSYIDLSGMLDGSQVHVLSLSESVGVRRGAGVSVKRRGM